MLQLLLRIVERGGLHFVASTFVVTALFFALEYVVRKYGVDYIIYLCSVAVVTAVIGFHEVFDVYQGADPFPKGFTDIASWVLGGAVSCYAIYRIRKMRKSV